MSQIVSDLDTLSAAGSVLLRWVGLIAPLVGLLW